MTTDAQQSLLKALLAPSSVAIIGASDDPKRLTSRPMRFLAQHGYRGRVYPINPRRDTVLGVRAYKALADLPETVEHAYILLDTDLAMRALEDCARAGVRVVSMLADGFAEAGEDGRGKQAALVKLANAAGILLVGPNSTGVVGTHARFSCTTNAAFAVPALHPGRYAALSQSGSVIGTLLSRGQGLGIDFSALISVGNEAQAGLGTFGELLADDPSTDGFMLFMETIRDRDKLAHFARRARSLNKPVVAYMIGRSDEGRSLSVSHTGALTGGFAAVDSFLKSIGIRRVETFEALLEAPRALRLVPQMRGRPRTVTAVSTTGGGGAMVVDQIAARGVAISALSPESRQALEAHDIPLGHGKLVDVTLAGTRYEALKRVVSTIIEDPATGALVMAIGSSAQFNPELSIQPIIDAVKEASPTSAPVLAFPLPHAERSLAMLSEGGVPNFRSVESCAETVALLLTDESDMAPGAHEALPAAVASLLATSEAGVLDETQSSQIFAGLGIARPHQVVLNPNDEIPVNLPLAYPVVAKLISPDLPHKTEAGAVAVGIKDRAALTEAVARMRTSASAHAPGYCLTGVLIQEMVTGLCEALIGFTRDPLAGPVVTVAMGGVFTEIYADAVCAPAPVSYAAAQRMITTIKGFTVLRGFRGKPKGDINALAQAIARVSLLALAPNVAEAEINPVAVLEEGKGITMLDALVRLN